MSKSKTGTAFKKLLGRLRSISLFGFGLGWAGNQGDDPGGGRGGDAEVGVDGVAIAGSGGGAGGGAGGKARVKGSGIAIGGPGGGGGPGERGGVGGGGEVSGDGMVVGGEGGEAGQWDRGGRGGRSGMELSGQPNVQLPDGRWLWEFGRGGDGADPSPGDDATGEHD